MILVGELNKTFVHKKVSLMMERTLLRKHCDEASVKLAAAN